MSMLGPNFAALLAERCRDAANQAAILVRGETTSYGQLGGQAALLAGALAHQVRPGERVAIFLERGPSAAAAFFGSLWAGAVVINVTETLRPRQIEHIVRHAGARVLLTSSDMLSRLPRGVEAPGLQVIHVEDIHAEPLAAPVPRIGNDPAQIIYTSGSTGLPKGVTLSHANLWAGMTSVTQYLGIGPLDRLASLLPFSFVYGLNQLFCAVGTGATLVVERSPLPQRIVTTLRESEVTVLPCVPPLWLQLLEVPSFRNDVLPCLRLMTNAGGRLPTHAVRALREAQPQAALVLMYGLTEALRSTYLPSEEVDRHPDSIGRAIPGAEILVMREDGHECAPGEVGELVHRGPTVALGYWNDPEATARVYRPNPLRPAGAPDLERVVYSGDLVRRDEDGLLYFVGRRDRMIKTLGYRVSPDEVAEVLYASGEVAEAVIGTEPDADRGDRIVAFVVLARGGALERLEAYCKAELPRYMQPGRIEVRQELPRTASGKHDTGALRAEA